MTERTKIIISNLDARNNTPLQFNKNYKSCLKNTHTINSQSWLTKQKKIN